jgi:hypothetical protein
VDDVNPSGGGTALIEAARRAIEEAPAPAEGVEVARAVAPYPVTEVELAEGDKPYVVQARGEGRDLGRPPLVH